MLITKSPNECYCQSPRPPASSSQHLMDTSGTKIAASSMPLSVRFMRMLHLINPQKVDCNSIFLKFNTNLIRKLHHVTKLPQYLSK